MPDICMQHMCAIMLIDGRVTFASSHDSKRMRDRDVLALRRRIELRGDEALSAAMPSRQGIVELRMRDGSKLTHHTKAVRGTAENPMARSEVDEKSYDLMAPVVGKARARKLCEAVWKLEKVGDVRDLRPLLARLNLFEKIFAQSGRCYLAWVSSATSAFSISATRQRSSSSGGSSGWPTG